VVPLGTAKGDVGGDLRQSYAPRKLALPVEHQDTRIPERCIGATPDVAGDVGAQTVRPAVRRVGGTSCRIFAEPSSGGGGTDDSSFR
jgi:hypothetical protein